MPASPEEDASAFALAFRQPDPRLELSADGRQKAQVFSRYYQGLALERAGMVDAALDAYEKALREAPQQQRLAYRASELAGQFRDIERGLKILEENFRRNPGEPEAYIRLSSYLSTYHDNRKERLDRSLEVLRQAADRFPQNAEICEQLILAFLIRQEPAQALAVLEKATQQDTKDPAFWLHLARVAPRIHRIEKGSGHPAINSLYEKALGLSEGDVQTGTRVGDYYRLTEQYERAKEVYQAIIARHPEELEAREKLAAIYTLLGDEERMFSTLLELERINPHRVETQKLIAQLYLKRGALSKSIEHYLKSFRLAQGTTQEYMAVAQMMCLDRRPQEAVELLKRARFHYPEDLELMVELADAHNAAKEYDTALKTFQEAEKIAEKLRPDLLNDAFYFSYGAAAERSKKFAEAEELFRKSIKFAPEDSIPARAARPYNYLGYMWLEQDKNIEEAGELIQRANELSPGEGAYVDSLGWYYFKAGDFPRALETLLEAEQLLAEESKKEKASRNHEADSGKKADKAPEDEKDEEGEGDAVIYDHIAQAFFKLGHKQRALDYLQKAVDLEPENQEYRARLKQYQEAEGLVPAALDFLDRPGSSPGEKDPPSKGPVKAVPQAPEKPAG